MLTHKRSTQLSEKSHLKAHLRPMLGHVAMKDIDAELAQGVVAAWIDNGLHPKTIRNLVATLRVMWEFAKQWNYASGNPWMGVSLPERGLPKQFCFTLAEADKIISAAEEPYRTFYWLIAETGIRSGEVCGLTLPNLDLNNRVIYIRQSVWRGRIQTVKTKKGFRSFEISSELAQHLEGHLKTWHPNPHQLIFATSNGTPWNADMVRKRHLHPLLRKLGVQQCGFHAFRHFNATQAQREGASLKLVQERLGHVDASTTLNYSHVASEDGRRLAERLGDLLAPGALKGWMQDGAQA
jgi:integrase